MKKPKDPHYLNNAQLIDQIRLSRERDELTTKAVQMFMLLARKTITKMYYHDQADREDCFQTGLLQMLLHWRSFNEEKGTNAFAYYTEIFKRGLAKGYVELNYLKGDKDRSIRVISLSGGPANEDGGMYNL
jgi:DNA-directed RNA polymerase specialized sigma subunit